MLLVLALLMLPVGLSSLSIAHGMDLEPEVHQQHQCEIYDVVENAVITCELGLSVANTQPIYHTYTLFEILYTLYELPRTRSPPLA